MLGPDQSLSTVKTKTLQTPKRRLTESLLYSQELAYYAELKINNLFVFSFPATWRGNVIAVEPHRQAIFGLGFHIVPGRQTLVSVPFCEVRLIGIRTLFFMWKRILEISSYCPHLFPFNSTHLCGLSMCAFWSTLKKSLQSIDICFCSCHGVRRTWFLTYNHFWWLTSWTSLNNLK